MNFKIIIQGEETDDIGELYTLRTEILWERFDFYAADGFDLLSKIKKRMEQKILAKIDKDRLLRVKWNEFRRGENA